MCVMPVLGKYVVQDSSVAMERSPCFDGVEWPCWVEVRLPFESDCTNRQIDPHDGCSHK